MKESYQRNSKMMAQDAPGVSISLVDLCRNKILSYFADERVKIRAYEQYALSVASVVATHSCCIGLQRTHLHLEVLLHCR